MKIDSRILSVAILFSTLIAGSVFGGQRQVKEEVATILRHVDSTTLAIVWIDLIRFDRSQSVPCPNEMLDFSALQRHPELKNNRPFMKHVRELRELGVKRIWFCVYPGLGNARARRAILPCESPQQVGAFLTPDKFDSEKVRVQVTDDSVVVHLSNATNEKIDEESRGKWSGLESALPELDRSHGYIGRDAFYFFLAPANSKIKQYPELSRYVSDTVPHVDYFYFRKRLPNQHYEIAIRFDTPESMNSAKRRLDKLIADTDENLQGIQFSAAESELRILATSAEGELRLGHFIKAVRPDYGTQLP